MRHGDVEQGLAAARHGLDAAAVACQQRRPACGIRAAVGGVSRGHGGRGGGSRRGGRPWGGPGRRLVSQSSACRSWIGWLFQVSCWCIEEQGSAEGGRDCRLDKANGRPSQPQSPATTGSITQPPGGCARASSSSATSRPGPAPAWHPLAIPSWLSMLNCQEITKTRHGSLENEEGHKWQWGNVAASGQRKGRKWLPQAARVFPSAQAPLDVRHS